MHREALLQLLRQPVSPQVVICGDLFLEHYVAGKVEQICPEAPVPILEVLSEEIRLGGAGEVATFLAHLGVKVVPVAPIGGDRQARLVRRLLDADGIDSSGLVSDPEYRTGTVMWFVGRSVSPLLLPVLRAHWRSQHLQAQSQSAEKAMRKLRTVVGDNSTLLLLPACETWLGAERIRQLVEESRLRRTPVIAIPGGGVELACFRGASCLLVEWSVACTLHGRENGSPREVASVLAAFAQECEIDSFALWNTPDVTAWYGKKATNKPYELNSLPFTASAENFAELLALTTLVYAMGGHWPLAAELFQLACCRAGGSRSLPGQPRRMLTRKQLEALLESSEQSLDAKVLTVPILSQQLANGKLAARPIVFVGGNFENLEPAQVAALEWARGLGEALVVGIRSDRCLQNRRGRAGGLTSQAERAAMVASLAWVDAVVVSEDPGFADVLKVLRPQIVVKGIESPWDCAIGWQFVEHYGGQIVTAPIIRSGKVPRLPGEIRGHISATQPGEDLDEPKILRFPAAA